MQLGCQQLHALDLHGLRQQFIALAGGQLALQCGNFLFQRLDLLQSAGNAAGQLSAGGFQRSSGAVHRGFQALHIGQGIGAGNGLYPAHACGHATFGHDLEQPNVARALHMRAAAQLAAGADVQHAHRVAVLLTKQHHRARGLGRFNVHHAGIGGGVSQDFLVHQCLDLADLLGGDRCVVREVKARALGVDQAAFLLDVIAQHFVQGFVHDVRDRVVAHGGGAQLRIDGHVHAVAHAQHALGHLAVVAKHIGLDLLRVVHSKAHACSADDTLVTHLAAAFCIKRSAFHHNHAVFTGFQFGNWRAVSVKRYDFGVFDQMLIAGELVGCALVIQQLVHLELARRACRFFLVLHGSVETGLVHAHAALTAHIVGQVEREAIGVVQLEGHIARQHLDITCQCGVQDFHAVGQRFKEALFFHAQHIGDARFLCANLGVGVAHHGHQVLDQLVEERGFLA